MGDDVGCRSHLKTATCGSPRHASKASWGKLKPKAGLLPPPAASTTTPDGVSHKGIRNWTQRLLANKNIRYLLYYLCLASINPSICTSPYLSLTLRIMPCGFVSPMILPLVEAGHLPFLRYFLGSVSVHPHWELNIHKHLSSSALKLEQPTNGSFQSTIGFIHHLI